MRGSTTEEFESFLAAHAPIRQSTSFVEGECVGEWRITAFLGKGGSGEVYRAENVRDHTPVALKIHVPRPGKSDSQENSAKQRFDREARILSENTYPFFPRFYGRGEARGFLYFAIELLENVTLPSADAEITSFLLKVSAAVRVLHLHGLVHRDIKPQNIMRRANGDLVLIDLGLVKESSASASPSGASVTLVDGKLVGVGTPRYAAPEQFNGGAVSPATDIHALGMLANECFGGRPPRAWERIISRSTSSIPERRYGDIDAFTQAIRHRHYGRLATWCGIAAAVLAIVVAIIIGRARTPAAAHIPATAAPHASENPSPQPTWRTLARDIQTNIVERQFLYEKYTTNDFGMVMLSERAWRNVTNSVAGTIIRLNNQRHSFAAPMLLETNRAYWIVGPGTLDVPLNGKPGSKVCLDNCVLINRTTNSVAACGVRYVFRKGSYLNFINLDRNEQTDYNAYMEDFEGAYNALKFEGPETLQALLKRRVDESRRLLELENR